MRAGGDKVAEADEQDETQTNFVSRSKDPARIVTDQSPETQRGAVSGEPGALGAAAYKPVVVGSVFEDPDKQSAEDRAKQDAVDQKQAIRPEAWAIGQDRLLMPYENAVSATTAQNIADGGWRENRPWSPEDSAGAAAMLTRQQIEDLDKRRFMDAQRSPERSGPNVSLISRLDPGAQPRAGLADSPVFSTLRSSDIAGEGEGGITPWRGLGAGSDFGSLPSVGFEPAINTPTRDAPLLSPSSSRSLGGVGDEPNMRTRALPW